MHCTHCGSELASDDRFSATCSTPRPRLAGAFVRTGKQFGLLKTSYEAGNLTEAQYNAALQDLILQDEAGAYWMIGAETGRWYRHDGQEWVSAQPPAESAEQAAVARSATSPPSAPAAMAPTARRRPKGIWFAGVIVGILLVSWASSYVRGWLARQASPLAPSPTAPAVRATAPVARPTATPGRTPTTPPATGVPVVFADAFDDNSGGWTEGEDQFGTKRIEDGEYHIWVTYAGAFTGGGPSEAGRYADFEFEVDARLVEGPTDSTYGLVFRYLDADNYYYFRVSGDGTYTIFKLVAGEWRTLKESAASTAIHAGYATNRLRVACQGNSIVVYVNDHPLAAISDASLAEGSVGLVAGAPSDPGTHVAFDNVRVRKED